MAETKKKLPKSEWDFSRLNALFVTHAFFYEYSRQSSKVKELVGVYRELIPYIADDIPYDDWIFKTDKLVDLSEEDVDALWARTERFKNNTYLALIRWLAYCKKFPDTPFLELTPKDYLNGPEVPINVRVFPVNGRSFCDMGYHWVDDSDEEDPYVLDLNSGVPHGLFCPIDVSESSGPHISMHQVRIDWWKTDSELKAEFAEWLAAYRKFLKVKPIPSSKRGLLNRPLDLPKECRKKETALMHLGKLRCLEATGTWEKYLALYHGDKSDRRFLEKDVSAARKIIAWLEEKV